MDKAFFTFTNKARSPMLFAVFPFFNSCLSIVDKQLLKNGKKKKNY